MQVVWPLSEGHGAWNVAAGIEQQPEGAAGDLEGSDDAIAVKGADGARC